MVQENTTGFMYNLDLLMMGLWGLKHVEEKGNPDTVYRRKRIVYQVGNKNKINYTEMHGQQDIKKYWHSCQWPGVSTFTINAERGSVYMEWYRIQDSTDSYLASLMISLWTCYVLWKFLVRFSTQETWRTQVSRATESRLASAALVIRNTPPCAISMHFDSILCWD
jgi:hypothetical protein